MLMVVKKHFNLSIFGIENQNSVLLGAVVRSFYIRKGFRNRTISINSRPLNILLYKQVLEPRTHSDVRSL